jgi:SPP1 family predicted phage head-tail adaptor
VNELLYLIQTEEALDAYGDLAMTETRRQVFARLSSIGQKEFYQAQATGLQPELKFVLADYLDYNGEQLVEHNGQRYRVLRTYRNGLELELTVYREVNPA